MATPEQFGEDRDYLDRKAAAEKASSKATAAHNKEIWKSGDRYPVERTMQESSCILCEAVIPRGSKAWQIRSKDKNEYDEHVYYFSHTDC